MMGSKRRAKSAAAILLLAGTTAASGAGYAIAEIADIYGGVIVGAYPDLRIYQLRFAGYGPKALQDLSETIKARSDVDWVQRDLVGPGFSFF